MEEEGGRGERWKEWVLEDGEEKKEDGRGRKISVGAPSSWLEGISSGIRLVGGGPMGPDRWLHEGQG